MQPPSFFKLFVFLFLEVFFFLTLSKIVTICFIFVTETCAGVQCGDGKKCVQRKSGPKCVCSPECRSNNNSSKGPVCGTDGRSYRTLCRLRKRACRRKSHTLFVAYDGHCQSKSYHLS